MIPLQDTLYIVLIFGALWVTIFACWFLWQLISVLKGVREVLSEVQARIQSVEQAIHGVRAKFEDGSRHVNSLSESIKDYFKNLHK